VPWRASSRLDGSDSLAAERPEQLLGIWHNHPEESAFQSPRVRGATYGVHGASLLFSYALLAFALLNISNVAFVLSVIGANLVWPVALYSSNIFAGARRAAVITPMASE
jgi:hypothetical protein